MGRTPITTRSPKKPNQQFPRVAKMSKSIHKAKKPSETLQIAAKEKKDWEDAMCSVCMERPHNAVLLLCSSHEKGCRPYMCGTGPRLSNCLAQFKKAYSKVLICCILLLHTLGCTRFFFFLNLLFKHCTNHFI